ATRDVTDDLAVFVHLVDADGRPLAQHDSRPANGDAPTAGWTPGEFIQDPHRLVVPPETPPGTYRVIVGLYAPHTGARRAVVDAEGAPVGDFAQLFVGVLQ
ncbi:MAG: hypothetical protein NZ518_09190, partial [Dehalococcoidia bacterium]|nr:hypothetical protein [Dehalococcoidia bacterium]